MPIPALRYNSLYVMALLVIAEWPGDCSSRMTGRVALGDIIIMENTMRDLDWFGRRSVLVALLALAAALPTRLEAQFSIAPTVGIYVPTTNLIAAASGSPNALRQEVSITFGGRMAIGFGRLGLDVSGEYAPSSLVFSAAGVDSVADANILTGTGQVRLQVLPVSSPISLSVSGGVSLTSRGGQAFQGVNNTTNVGGVVGASLGVRVGPFVHLMVTAEDYIYNAKFVSGVATQQQTQHDIHLNFGVGIPLLGT